MSREDERNRLPATGRVAFVTYLAAVSIPGVTLAGLLIGRVVLTDSGLLAGSVAFWMALALVGAGEARPLFLPGLADPVGVATSATFSYAALLHLGLPVAILLHVSGVLAAAMVRRPAWWRTVFNVAQYSISLAAAWATLTLAGYHASLPHPASPRGGDIPVIALAGVAYFLVNNVLVSSAVSLFSQRSLLATMRADFGYHAGVNTALLAVAPLVAVVMDQAAVLLPLFVLPLVAIHKHAEVSVAREHEALHDALTGLPNRVQLLERTETTLGRDINRPAALFLLDLDRFKEVNDTLGHPAGDEVLQIVAVRLRASLRPGDVVARLGGDEFAVLLPEVADRDTAVELAHRLRAALDEPIQVAGTFVTADASIGIALAPEHGSTFELLHQRADVAMYLAKAGRGVEVYSAERDTNSPQRLGLLTELRGALERDEIEVHFQPKVRLADARVVGAEALVRWRHPDRGMVPPDEFVPLAEQSGLMPRLTDRVLAYTTEQAAGWWASGHPLVVAVNVSIRDLLDPGFLARVDAALGRSQLPAEALILEITERVLISDYARGLDVLESLRRLGVGLSLDDFGTGYSSLTMLRRLPVSEIKIDRSFTARVLDSPEDESIVRSIAELAHALGLTVVAEGVEDAPVRERVARLGCDLVQGWLTGRPVRGTELAAVLAAQAPACPRAGVDAPGG